MLNTAFAGQRLRPRDEYLMIRSTWTAMRFGLIGLFVMGVVTVPWSLAAVVNLRLLPHLPWAIPLTLVYLCLVVSYLGGKGWPASTRELRRRYLRARMPTPRASAWSLLSGGSAIAALWLVFAAVGGFERHVTPGREATLGQMVLLASVIVSAAVTATGEEAGLRGFMQAPLEAQLGPAGAIGATTTAFVIIHASHGLPALLYMSPFYVATGIVYGLLAYLTQSSLPSLVLHFLGDIGVFALRSSLIRVSGIETRSAGAFCIAGALMAVGASVVAFRQLASITAPIRDGSDAGP
jgi:membrane protease YdiL (CAAX protease family)